MKAQQIFERFICGWKTVCAVFLLCITTTIASRAQSFNTLVSFDGSNGEQPFSALIQGIDGNFYGTTWGGGNYGSGTIFKITPVGTLSTLHSFCAQPNCTDGSNPYGGLILATDGRLYGTATGGGANNAGTVFKITNGGTLTTIYSFCSQTNCADGNWPIAPLAQATDGYFYGGTGGGGANNAGTLFKMTLGGALTTLYSFCSLPGCMDGAGPSGLIQATDGNLYGTVNSGGHQCDFGLLAGCGGVFRITTQGTFNRVYLFGPGSDGGASPMGSLVEASDGNLYGTTVYGNRCGGTGVVFKVTPKGTATIYSFCWPDNPQPEAGLVQATDGNLYGTTAGDMEFDCSEEGGYGCGTIFSLALNGTLSTLHAFNSTDGATPGAALLQATNGVFYGTSRYGGVNDNNCGGPAGCGTVFSLDMGFGPFVSFVRGSGRVGARVGILGNNLTGTTSVTFNGTAAQFSVPLSTLILAQVPSGATSGTVQVTPPGQTLSSNVPFYVLK